MTLVVDASVATKWFVAEPDSPDARALLLSGEVLIAPDLVVAEACNVAWKKRRAGQITPAQAAELAAEVGRFFDALAPMKPLAPRALAIADALAHPVYDCFYLALAEQAGARLVTADARLLGRLRGTAWQALAIRPGDAAP